MILNYTFAPALKKYFSFFSVYTVVIDKWIEASDSYHHSPYNYNLTCDTKLYIIFALALKKYFSFFSVYTVVIDKWIEASDSYHHSPYNYNLTLWYWTRNFIDWDLSKVPHTMVQVDTFLENPINSLKSWKYLSKFLNIWVNDLHLIPSLLPLQSWIFNT